MHNLKLGFAIGVVGLVGASGCMGATPPIPTQTADYGQNFRSADEYCYRAEQAVSPSGSSSTVRTVSLVGMVVGGLATGLGGSYFINETGRTTTDTEAVVNSGSVALAGAVVAGVSAAFYAFAVSDRNTAKTSRLKIREIRRETAKVLTAEPPATVGAGMDPTVPQQVAEKCQAVWDDRDDNAEQALDGVIKAAAAQTDRLKMNQTAARAQKLMNDACANGKEDTVACKEATKLHDAAELQPALKQLQ